MKVDTTTRFGFRLLVNLAQVDGIKSLAAISKEENISRKYLEQIILRLRKNDIITGYKGINGGYKLNTDPSKISLFQIYKALEDREHILFCLDDKEPPCKNGKNCKTKKLWKCLDNEIRGTLKKYSLADLINDKKQFNGSGDSHGK
ncbi:MAG: Rrf2 family transcriptional regulator [bacterium]|nr:Rrf2 family transcriptional regulator [bacterium]